MILLICTSFLFSSCDDEWAENNGYKDLTIQDYFNPYAKAELNDKNGTLKNLDLSQFCDEERNPIFDAYKSISFYPRKDIKHYYFGSMAFTIYVEGENSYQNIVIKVSIEDLFIEYEIRDVEVTLEDGSVVIEQQKVETGRQFERIYLNGEGEQLQANGVDGLDLGIDLDYEIKQYSSSTAFKIEVFQEDGITYLESNWAIDELSLICVDTSVTPSED